MLKCALAAIFTLLSTVYADAKEVRRAPQTQYVHTGIVANNAPTEGARTIQVACGYADQKVISADCSIQRKYQDAGATVVSRPVDVKMVDGTVREGWACTLLNPGYGTVVEANITVTADCAPGMVLE